MVEGPRRSTEPPGTGRYDRGSPDRPHHRPTPLPLPAARRSPMRRPLAVRVVAAISGAAWVWSWYTMYLEIHRWKHVTPSFRFNPRDRDPGHHHPAPPGLPLKVLFVC